MNHEHEPHRTNIYAHATRNRKIKNGLLFDISGNVAISGVKTKIVLYLLI